MATKSNNVTKHGFYNVKGIKGKDGIMIVPIGMVEVSSNDIIPPKMVTEFNLREDVVAHIMIPNIMDTELMSTKKLPVMAAHVVLNRRVNVVPLLHLCIFFTIESNPTCQEELIKCPLKGRYSIELFTGEVRKELDKDFDHTIRKRDLLTKLLKSEEMSDIIGDLLENEKRKNIQQYGNPYDFTVPENVISLKDYKVDD